jgi:type IV secretion system protein VirB1
MIAAALLACAATVAPLTMDRVIAVESHGNPLAIHVNRLAGLQPVAHTVQEAAAMSRRYLASGYSVDLGLSQLNSANLARFGLTIEGAFDPCKNIAAGGAVLSAFYGKAVQRYGEGQAALAAALSGYNTGDLQRGFNNGYVGKYYVNVPLPVQPSLNPPVPTWPAAAPNAPSMLVYVRPGLDLQSN